MYESKYASMCEEIPIAEPVRSMSGRWRLIWCVSFFGPAIAAGVSGDLLVAAIVAAAGLGALSGFRIGAFSIFTSLVAMAGAIAYAPALGMQHAYRFQQWFGTTGLTNRFLSIAIVGVGISLVVTTLLLVILGKTIRQRPSLDRANRCAGFLAGSLQGIAAVVFFVGGMLMMEPLERERAEHREQSGQLEPLASRLILATAESTRASRVGALLVHYNPLERIPELNKVQELSRSAQVLADPAKINKLLQRPEIAALRQRPEIQKLVDELNEDPRVQEILHSDGPLDQEKVLTLLSHPAVMDLVDQPGFLEEVRKAMAFASPGLMPALVH